jgi:perosamine synthetase
VVHLYGHPCEMDSILSIANEYNLFVIEDCAEAFGSRYKGRDVGGFGHISTFSFFGNKTITTGEGGMVVTNDKTLFERAIHFRGQGLASHREYWHDVIGYNYRMTNICAAIGLAQLESAEIFIERKREIARLYRTGLAAMPVEVHPEAQNVWHTYWMTSILVADASERDHLRAFLAEGGIETRPLFYPVHTMPMYSEKFQRLPVAENLGWRGLNLPSWPGLSNDDIGYVIDRIFRFYGDLGR